MIFILYRFLSLFIFLSGFSSTDIENDIIYKATYQVEMMSNSDAPVAPQGFGNLNDDIASLEYELIFNQDKAIFRMSSPLLVNDENDLYDKIFKVASQSNRTYYYNLKEEKYSYVSEIKGEARSHQLGNRKKCWEFLPGSVVINGLTCLPAKCKSQRTLNNNEIVDSVIEAYFTKDISVAFGPAGYHGLPGLMVQVSDGRKTWKLTRIEKLSNFNINEFLPPENEKTSSGH